MGGEFSRRVLPDKQLFDSCRNERPSLMLPHLKPKDKKIFFSASI
jgi:hypothetical protein